MDFPWLYEEVLGNPVKSWLAAGAAFAAFLSAGFFLKRVVLGRLRALAERTDTGLDDAFVRALAAVRGWELAFVALALAARSLYVPPAVDRALHVGLVLVASFRAAAFLQEVMNYLWRSATAEVVEGDPTSRSALRNVEYVLSALVWLGAVLFVLDNLGVNITTAVAGLGIGGIAVAMAAQQILGDLFSSFVIFMDKPFRVGDTISVDGLAGTVENVGLKTTHVRSVSGEMLVFSNSDLTRSRLKNFKQLTERRGVIAFSVPFDTPRAKLALVPGLVNAAFQGKTAARFDRAHYTGFSPSGHQFEAVWFAVSEDLTVFMNLQQAVHLDLLDSLEREKISLAYPTQTVNLSK
ncbi:MAG: mechanosensitive ion channel protein MscS [Elusimicrobia bacterium]|nr:MAG: mechanosensitive ion channel protein MscS [Elusimicrobiota bacterium]